LPHDYLQGYATAARRLGAKIRVGTPAVEILTDTTGVAGVRTLDEVISTRAIVVAAGIASGDLTRPLDFDLPVRGGGPDDLLQRRRSGYLADSDAGRRLFHELLLPP
jgi:glycine/D-amino acid oxidase-like deaminating enzyme